MTYEHSRIARSIATVSLVVAVLLAHAAAANAEKVTVLSSNGFKAAMQDLAPQFEKATGHELTISYSVSAELKKRIDGGEAFDLLVITPAQMDALIKSGRIVASTRAPLARAGMALAVRRGAPKPDIHTVDALKATLAATKSIAFAKEGTGGVFLMGLLKQFGIVEQMTPKFKPTVTGDEVSQAVAHGEAELGVLPLSEILPVPGVEVAGTFPAEVQEYAVMIGGVSATATHAAAAKALLDFLAAPAAVPVIEKKGMERPPR